MTTDLQCACTHKQSAHLSNQECWHKEGSSICKCNRFKQKNITSKHSKLELDGVVYLVEFDGDKEIGREPLNSQIVLDALIASLAGGLDKMKASSHETWSPIDKNGNHMCMVDFISAVRSGMLTDDDGTGYYATATHVSEQTVDLAHIDRSYTHIVWFNK